MLPLSALIRFSLALIVCLVLILYLHELTHADTIYITNRNGAQDARGNSSNQFWVTANRARAGDGTADNEFRAFLGVSLGSIGAGAVVTSATLHIVADGQNCTHVDISPYYVSLVDFNTNLSSGDFGSPAIGGYTDFAVITPINDNENWYAIDVADQVQYCLDNPKSWTLDGSSNWFQLRIRPSGIRINGLEDYFGIYTVEKLDKLCYLEVTYFFPAPFDHFVISHNTNSIIDYWERITITAKDSNEITVMSNIGTATIDVEAGIGTIKWSNAANCGTYDDTTISGKVIYTFASCDNGVLTLYIRDDSPESVNIRVRDGPETDDDTEGFLHFRSLVFGYFVIDHDKQAVVNQWEPLSITAKSTDGYTILNYAGTITISAPGATGIVDWQNDAGNCGTYSNLANGKAVYTFAGLCESGTMFLDIRDSCEESLDIEVISAVTAKVDDDSEGLLAFYTGDVY